MIQEYLDVYEFDDSFARLDFDLLETWLTDTYWSPRIKKAEIRKGALNSTLVMGCYLGRGAGGGQVGYLRLVSDKTRFGYLMGVYVATHRRKGIAGNMVRFAMEHPDLRDVYLWLLATKDGHPVYAKAGFAPLPAPEHWMMIRKEKERP